MDRHEAKEINKCDKIRMTLVVKISIILSSAYLRGVFWFNNNVIDCLDVWIIYLLSSGFWFV